MSYNLLQTLRLFNVLAGGFLFTSSLYRGSYLWAALWLALIAVNGVAFVLSGEDSSDVSSTDGK